MLKLVLIAKGYGGKTIGIEDFLVDGHAGCVSHYYK
jgi:hypothetical protein